MRNAFFASRPCGAPAGARRSGSGGERRRSGMSEPSPTAHARDMELVPTRRMPSDAVAALWLEELEGLA